MRSHMDRAYRLRTQSNPPGQAGEGPLWPLLIKAFARKKPFTILCFHSNQGSFFLFWHFGNGRLVNFVLPLYRMVVEVHMLDRHSR